MEKKKVHNDLEKKRKDKLKIAIDNIRKALPHRIINNKKLTHFDVLNVAIDYMQQLEIQNKEFLENNAITLGEETILLRERVDNQTQQISKLLEIIEKCYIVNGTNIKNDILLKQKSVNKEITSKEVCNKHISKLLSIQAQSNQVSVAKNDEKIEPCIPLFASSDLPFTTSQIVILQPTSSDQLISNFVNSQSNICSLDKATDTNFLSIITNDGISNCLNNLSDSIINHQEINISLNNQLNNEQLVKEQNISQQINNQQLNNNQNTCNENLNGDNGLGNQLSINFHSNDEHMNERIVNNNCNSLNNGVIVFSSCVDSSTQTFRHSKVQTFLNKNKSKANYKAKILQGSNYRNILRKYSVNLFCDHCSKLIKIKSKKNQEISDNLIDELDKNTVRSNNVESLIDCELSNSNQFSINNNAIATESPSLQNKSHFNEYSIEDHINTTGNIGTVEPIIQTKSLNSDFEHSKIEGKSKQNIWMPARIVNGIVDADSFVSHIDQPQYNQVSDSTKQFDQNADLLDNSVCFQLPPFHSSYCLHPATQTKNYAHDISTLIESQKLSNGDERIVNIFDNLPPADNLLYSFDYLADADLSIFDDAFDKSNQISFSVFDKNNQVFEKNQMSFWQSSLFEPMRCQKNNIFDSYILPSEAYNDKETANVEFISKEPSSISNKLQHKPASKTKLSTFSDIYKKNPIKEELNLSKEVKSDNFLQMYISKSSSDNFDLLKLTSASDTFNKSSEGKSVEPNTLVTFRPHEQLSDNSTRRQKFDNHCTEAKKVKYCSEVKPLPSDSFISSISQNPTLYNNSSQANNTCNFKKSNSSVNSIVLKNNEFKYPESLKNNFNEAPFYDNAKTNTITYPIFTDQFTHSFKSDDFKNKSKRTNINYNVESKSSAVSPNHRPSMQKDFSFYPLSYYDNNDENKVDAYYSNWSCMNRQKMDTSIQQNLFIQVPEVISTSYDQSSSTSNHLAFTNVHLKPFPNSLHPSTNLECDKIQHTNFDPYISNRTKSKKIIEKLPPDQNMSVNDQQPTYLNPSSRPDSGQVSDDNFKIDQKSKKKVSLLPPIHHFGIRNLCSNNQQDNKPYISNNFSSNHINNKPHSFSHSNYQPSIFNNNQLFNHNNSQSSLLNQNNNQPPLFSHNNNNQPLLFNRNTEPSIFINNNQPPIFNHNNNHPTLFSHNNNQPSIFNQSNQQNLFNHINDQQPLFNQNNESSIFNHNNNSQQSIFGSNNNNQVITINKLLGHYNQ